MEICLRNGTRFSNTQNNFKQESAVAKRETNDCVVRAVATAYDISYDRAHSYIRKHFLRQDKKGTYSFVWRIIHRGAFNELDKETGKKITEVTNELGRKFYKSTNKLRKKTTGTFLKENHKGVYLVEVRGHVFTIKDGVIYGNYADAQQLRTRILSIFKIENI